MTHTHMKLHIILALVSLFIAMPASAWDSEPDTNGKYDKYYDRPTHFPEFTQPSTWANAEFYLVCARLGENGTRIRNYEIAVYDQNGSLRHCSRSMAKDDDLCVLTIRGEEGDEFHCQIIYGDFVNPTIIDATEHFGFKTNDIVGTADEPFYLTGTATSSIQSVSMSNVPMSSGCYNLLGMRVNHPMRRGLYIIGGRKVFVK